MRAARITGWLFIGFGLLSAGSALRGWVTGEMNFSGGKNSFPRIVHRDREPKLFQAAVSGSAIQSGILLATGLVLLVIVHRLDRLEPMSPRFGGEDALDKLGAHLDRERRLRNLPVPEVRRPRE